MSRLKWKSNMINLLIFIFTFIFGRNAVNTAERGFADLAIANNDEVRSRLIMIDGNMYFYAGKHKNITFRVSQGASIVFGETDILQLPNRTETNAIRNEIRSSSAKMELYGRASIFLQKSVADFLRKLVDVKQKQGELAGRVNEMNDTLKSRNRANRKLKALILRLSGQIEKLLKLMRTDECVEEAPCKNGGTCIDLFGKYQCICPNHFEGKDCDKRVDECEMYSGTAAGCQNNGTCSNNIDSAGFTCHCPSGFHGHLCQQKHSSCDYSLDLCGEHGHCSPTENGYKCLCEWGYRSSGDLENPFCEDVDECRENPCYPGSNCLNLPGSFKCGSCPRGTIGNGIHCLDFDECLNDLTNDCSKDPKVDCINTHGSYKCGPCPAGYEGDGYHCEKISHCRLDRNPCHPNARCIEESVGEAFRCECPSGTIGDGIGPEGCQVSNTTLCSAYSCLNGGTCNTVSDTEYRCQCPYGYYGSACQLRSTCIADRSWCGLHGRCDVETSICICDAGYYGTHCQIEEEECNFHTSNETGTIVFEKMRNPRVLKTKTCNWHVQLFDTRKAIQIEIENITIPKLFDVTSKGCGSSIVNFTIFDGASTDSPILANFCHGNNTLAYPHPFYTSGSAVTFHLNSRLQTRNSFLKIHWKTVQTRCGGRLTANSGRIDYFDVHDEDACVWFVQVQPQYHIQITIDTLKMASGEFINCSVNSFEIFDNQFATNRTRVSNLCETQVGQPTVIRTSGSYAVIYFRLDTSQLGGDKCAKCQIGFNVHYDTIALPEGCGGEILPDENGNFEGFIQSPNYGYAYFANLDCLWVLNATSAFATTSDGTAERSAFPAAILTPQQTQQQQDFLLQDRKVAIEFVDFDVSTTVTQYATLFAFMSSNRMTSCNGDYVELVELDTFYCNHQPPPLNTPILNSPQLSIKFHSDETNSGKGFMIKYRTVCQRDFHSTNGTISSPNYPKAAQKSFKCVYRIHAEPDQAIRVKFNYIGIHTDYASCHYNREKLTTNEDYIELAGGYSSYRAINKRYYCEFFPFVAPNGEIVTSGNRPFEIIYSTSGTKSNTGFQFSYEVMDVGCGGVFNDDQKVITSPNYPESYLAHMYCIYHLSVRPDATRKALRLSFDVFDVENVGTTRDDDCEFDSVRLYEWFVDEESHGKLLGKFCGKSTPPPVLSTDERMVLVFTSDRSVSGAGFSAKIEAVDLTQDCDRTFIASSGQITFDPTLFSFTQSVQCDYRIVMPSNHRILLNIHNVSAPCGESSLMIRNGGSEESPGFPSLQFNSELCNDFPVKRLQSQGNRLFLRFKSSNTNNAFFNVSYEPFEQGCGGHIRGYSGSISAPQYPQQDSRTLNCEWQISVAAGNKVRLLFVDIDNLDSDDYFGGCSVYTRNLINVIDGPKSSENILRRYCKKENISTPIFSIDGNQLTVQYSQYGGSRNGAIYGFLAEFRTICRDMVLTGNHGTLQSPGYPDPMHPALFGCNWRIVTSAGSRVRLSFHRFRLMSLVHYGATSRGCQHTYLKIETPNHEPLINDTSPEKIRDSDSNYCGEALGPFEIIADSNIVDLTLSVLGIDRNIFWLTWSTVGCGGSLFKNNSRLIANASSDFSSSDLRQCEWKIVAPVGYVIRVDINEIFTAEQPQNDPTTLADGVEFYSGLTNSSGAPLKTFRGALKNVTFTSFSSELFALFTTHASTLREHFKADFARDGIIFDAKVSFVLRFQNDTFGGALIKLEMDSKVQIHSPNYPNAPPLGALAIWQFEAPPGFFVAYKILKFFSRNNWARNTSSAYNCAPGMMHSNGGISIYHGPYKPNVYRMQNVLQSFCDSINEPRIITTEYNVSGVIFRASKHEAVLRSGITPATDNSSALPAQIGFLMEVSCQCGGRLYASDERKSLIVKRHWETVPNCEWEILLLDKVYIDDEENDENEEETNEETSEDEEDARLIYLRIEKIGEVHSQTYADISIATEFEVFCGPVSKGTMNSLTFDDLTTPHYYEFTCDSKIKLVARNLQNLTEFLVSYDTESSFCGGELTKENGRIALAPNYATSPTKIECEWHISNIAGSFVSIFFGQINFLQTEFCEESYVEFREFNATGPLIGRFCRAEHFFKTIEKESIWIHFRYNFNPTVDVEQNGDGEPDYGITPSVIGAEYKQPRFTIAYRKKYGGETLSPIIESPPVLPRTLPSDLTRRRPDQKLKWIIRANGVSNYLRIEFIEYSFVEMIEIYDVECVFECSDEEERAIPVHFELAEGKKVFVVKSSVATIVSDRFSYFKIRWSEISPASIVKTSPILYPEDSDLAETNPTVFSCGSELQADFKPKTLQNPRNVFGRYANEEKCKWTIRRPQFSGIIINVTSIEMEEHVDCRYDFLALTTKSYDSKEELQTIPEWTRMCRKDQRGKMGFSYEPETFVYFITDRSRSFTGFTLEYYLSCNTFEYFPAYKGVLDATLTSPGYPTSYRANETCLWGMMLESNRDVSVQSVEIDLAPRDPTTNNCEVDFVEFSDKPYFGFSETNLNKFCGQEKINVTLSKGRTFIRFRTSDKPSTRKGFKVRISEILHDCSALDLMIDEYDPVRTISSPNFPQLSPNSLDCQWTLSAPPGRRLKFTVDPTTFNLQSTSTDECVDDFLEVRDGASAASPLVGRFCGVDSPSSIVSTGSHLHLSYVTDSITQSLGWNATFELENCGGVIALKAGHNSTIRSPNYPDLYPADTDCEWTVRAPAGHFVEAYIDFIFIAPIRNCTAEFLEIRDINSTGPQLQSPVCVKDGVSAGGYRSSHNTAYVRFLGNSTVGRSNRHRFCQYQKCGFKMHFVSTKFACGGIISDDSGTVYPPGYPDKIFPHVSCQWDFRAGIQNRYVLELEFLDKDHDFYTKSTSHLMEHDKYCLMNLEVWNGGLANRHIQYPVYHRFCGNSTVFVSSTDMATLIYDDSLYLYHYQYNSYNDGNRSQIYRPFHVKYSKVARDYDDSSCVFEVIESQKIEIKDLRYDFRKMWNMDLTARFAKSFCHIQIRKPAYNSTVRLDFTDFRGGRQGSKHCSSTENQVLVTDEHSDPFPVEKAICNGSLLSHDNISLTYVNPQIDVYVLNNPYTLMTMFDATVSFNLSVSFASCGGVITEEDFGMSGEISSPNFGFDNYTDATDCLWVLKAPEGRIIALEITYMDIEYHIECINDFLEISEGHDRLAVIHRYCNEKLNENELPERFKKVRSRSRSLSLLFHSDDSVNRKGFHIAYEFIDFDGDGCGFHSHAPAGVIHSPNYPSDYPDNAECIWDISVPPGFHIALSFDYLDIVNSRDCKNDFLLVSQEHQSRAMAPVGSYYFYFDHEETLKKVCGNELPSRIETESNRIRLNFTTDAKTTAKGFKARWDSVCGTVFKMNHGVITSPNYPNFYPNKNMVCEHLIDPETNGAPQIVTLKVWDVDLDKSHLWVRKECLSDYIEIRDVWKNISVSIICGATYQDTVAPAISIKGPIAIRFISNASAFHDTTKNVKYHRGFKISYALADCGGEVSLINAKNRMSAVITSPGFPLPYHHSLDCIWNITAPNGRIISYKFTDLDLEVSDECRFDYVEIVDGYAFPNRSIPTITSGGKIPTSEPTVLTNNRVQRICGRSAPEGQQRTVSNNLLVRFASDPSASRGGFRMVVTASLGPQNGCGGQLTASTVWQTLTPPINPDTNKYYSDLRCDWSVRAADFRRVIELRFTQLDMELKSGPPQPPSSSLAVGVMDADATTTVAPILAALPEDWHSNKNNNNGTEVDTCYDFVAVYDGPKSTSPFLVGPTCSVSEEQQLPLSFYSSYGIVNIYFESDSYDEYRGFSVDYRAIDADCGGTYLAKADPVILHYESERTLTRTNQRHKRCRFFFYSSEAQPIEISFTEFSFPSRSSDCTDEYAEIRDAGSVAECQHSACATEQSATTNAQIRTCGTAKPPLFVSKTSIVQLTTSVVLQSEYSAKFELKYQLLSACNRTIEMNSSKSGRITSPNYPNPYDHNSTCTTYLNASRDKRIFLVFKDFKLERSRYRMPYYRTVRPWSLSGSRFIGNRHSLFQEETAPNYATSASGLVQNCVYDVLNVYFNSSDPAKNITLCGFSLPDSILSTQNKMTLALKTDVTMSYGGYEAFYYTVTTSTQVKMEGRKEREITHYELETIREKHGSLTHIPLVDDAANNSGAENDSGLRNLTVSGNYEANMIMRATIVPPLGMECSLEFHNYEMSYDVAGLDCGDYLTLTRFQIDATSKNVPQTYGEGLRVQLPCKLEAGGKFPLPVGNCLVVEFNTDDSPVNDGAGFRLEWNCEPIKTPLL